MLMHLFVSGRHQGQVAPEAFAKAYSEALAHEGPLVDLVCGGYKVIRFNPEAIILAYVVPGIVMIPEEPVEVRDY